MAGDRVHRRPRRAGRYALSVLYWRGRGTTFALALLIQVVPFQLLIVPLCVLIARSYGLADSCSARFT